ncbi:MAG TPA: hypothetical protein VGR57_04065 [Ktedonobacterales bacterium]|nr:hypothetical protein [Ktedonobacterales bacterium]
MTAQPEGEQFASLAARLADLEQMVRTQHAEIERLRARAPEPRATPAPQDAASAAPMGAPLAPALLPTEPAGHSTRPSRRALLKLGGAAAAAGVAAVAASATELAHPDTAHAHSDTVGLYSNISGAGNVAIKGDGSSGANGVEGTTDNGYGLYGISLGGIAVRAESWNGGIAVNAISDAAGGAGVSASGYGLGVYGVSSSGTGIMGVSITSTGVVGSGNYGGYFNGTAAALVVGKNADLIGPPNTNNHQKGELQTDSNGLLWFCINDGSPGTWIRLAGPLSGYNGGAVAYLPAPIRLFDSRPGTPAPLPTTKGLLAGGSTTTIQVTGTIVGGYQVPPGAVGVIGNLTVTGTQGGGDLILYPTGAPLPNTSNINYAGGQTIANFASVGLSSGGAMNLYVHVSSTQAIFDVAGYVF